ncbi:MAG TPA: hypothetical protein VFQ43_08875, partial [Nitrososphaera sp.]|nr:hypothetical protein [Nitrososphaera sp.]
RAQHCFRNLHALTAPNLRPHATLMPPAAVAWLLEGLCGLRRIGFGAPGMNAILRVYPESGQSVIVLCNLDSPSASRMGDWLHARMPLR